MNSTNSSAVCPRCRNQAFAAYQHRDEGKCYLCGRLPEVLHERTGGTATPPRTAREQSIHALLTVIECVRERVGHSQRLDSWLESNGAWIEGELTRAPADVATRARAALGKLGVTSWPCERTGELS